MNELVSKIELFLFCFTVSFQFTIAGIELRYFILAFWLFYVFFKYKRVSIPKSIIYFLIGIVILLFYSLFVSLLEGAVNTFWLLRLSRAALSFVLIVLYIYNTKCNINTILETVILILFVHSVSVILGVIFPVVKTILLPISRYTKEFYSLRSTGLVSSYDNAGFLCNVGLIASYQYNKSKKKYSIIHFLVFSIATVFTSRFNILILFFTLIIILFQNNRKKGIMSKVITFAAFVLGGAVMIIFWVLTTNVDIDLRAKMFSKIPYMERIYLALMTSYTDYGKYTQVISSHLDLSGLTFSSFILGEGINAIFTDIGYLKDIYAVGILGTIFEVMIYLYTFADVRKISKHVKNQNSWLHLLYIIVIVYMLIMEVKMSFIFATTTFELVSILYVVILKEKNEFDQRMLFESNEESFGGAIP